MCSLSGHGAANVTLGIPRLREIVMTASTKPKTPSMTLPICTGAPLEKVETFCKRASRLALSQVVDRVVVNEQLTAESRHRMFTVTIHLYPLSECKEEYDVTAPEILAAFGAKFPLMLKKELMVEMKKLQTDIRTQLVNVGKGKAADASGGKDNNDDAGDEVPQVADDNEGSEIGDGDAAAEKRAKQSKQQATYESDDEDDGPLGEIDDAAIEAEFESNSSDDDDSMEGDNLSRKKPQSLAVQVNVVREMFMGNLKSATSFTFNETQANFGLEVRSCSLIQLMKCRKVTVLVVSFGSSKAPSCGHYRADMSKDCCTRDPGHRGVLCL